MGNIQKIHDDGQKRFFKNARKKGCFHLLQSREEQTFVFAEGYATSLSIRQATGQSVVVCFDAGNIEPVVKSWRDRYPESNLIIAGDNDI